MPSQQCRSRIGSWWWGAATTVALVGCTCALFTTPLPALVATFVVLAALALLVVTGVETTRADPRQTPLTAADWRRLADRTLTATVGAVAVVGLLQVSAGAAALVVVCLAVSAPWALATRPCTAGTDDDPAAEPVAPGVARATEEVAVPVPLGSEGLVPESHAEHEVPPPAGVTTMSTTELVLAWRRSYAELGRARSATDVHRLATRREQLLDELERRDGLGVQQWLRSGARAASDPSRFLQRPAGPSLL